MPEKNDKAGMILKEASLAYGVSADSDIDLSLLRDNLAKTPWERMQANDDALNFAELLHTAMKKHHAKPK
jgi:hypothetical protein